MAFADSLQSYLRRYWIFFAFIVIILIFTGLYLGGFRLGPGVHISRVGTITFENLPPGASVYADQQLEISTTGTSTKSIDLDAGDHPVIVSVPSDYPWNTLLSITSGENAVIRPILIPMQPDVTLLSGKAATTALASIASSTLPSESSPLTLANGCAHVYVSNNQILANAVSAAGCTPPSYLSATSSASTIIFSPASQLIGVFAYPGRQDAILIGMNDTLYALTLDPRSPRFFAPVLGATEPKLGSLSDGTIVIQNGSTVFSVHL